MKNQKGFSLVELLVVVIIIAIIAAIAIPSLLASRRAANEASAISSLRTIHSSEITYFSTTGGNANYGTLAELNGQGLIDSTLSGGAKSGYNFTLNEVSPIYCAAAEPQSTTSGTRSFGIETDGVIYAWAAAGAAAACAATGDLDPSGATGPIE